MSCKEDQLYGLNADTRTYLLADKKWQAAAIFVKSPQGIVLRDDLILQPDYEKDDYYFLRSDSTFELNDNAAMHPGGSGPVLATGTWMLVSSEEFIEFNSDQPLVFSDPLKIVSISSNEFSVEYPIPEGTKFISVRAIK